MQNEQGSRQRLHSPEVLRVLQHINRAILVGSPAGEILQKIANYAMEIFAADSCRICRYDSTTRAFTTTANAGLAEKWSHLPRPDGIGAHVLSTGDHIWEDDLKKIHPDVRKSGITFGGAFPLQPKEGEQVGVLYLHFRTNPGYADDEINIVYNFSFHAGLAIQLAELRARDERRISELQALRHAGILVAKAQSIRAALEQVVKGAVKVMRADGSIVYPWDSQAFSFQQDLVVGSGLFDGTNVFSRRERVV